MEFQTTAKLLGVKPSAGSMKGEDGENVTWDQIELHCEAPLDTSKGALGSTVQIHKWKFPGAAQSQQFSDLKKAVGKNIVLKLQMTADGKGGAPRPVLTGASAA